MADGVEDLSLPFLQVPLPVHTLECSDSARWDTIASISSRSSSVVSLPVLNATFSCNHDQLDNPKEKMRKRAQVGLFLLREDLQLLALTRPPPRERTTFISFETVREEEEEEQQQQHAEEEEEARVDGEEE